MRRRLPELLLLFLTLASPSLANEFKLTLENPGMESGHDVPEGWRGRFGKVFVTRDTENFHGGAAGLSVQNTASGTGCVHQMIEVQPGLKLKLGGWMKCAEGSKANFAAQFFDDKFTWNEFVKVKHLDGTQDWQHVEQEITVPKEATRMAIALYVDGVGRAWLDDVTLTAEGARVDIRIPDPGPAPPKEPEQAKLVPTTPVPGYYAEYPKVWMMLHEHILKRAKDGNVDIIFLGDSITQGWATAGKEHWDRHFAPLNAANFGIGGDKTGNVLWRIEHGEVDGLSPKLVVLMIGVNNALAGKNFGEEIAGGIRAVVEKLRAKLPQTKVLVLGILPIGAKPDDSGRLRVREINEIAARLDDGAAVRFLDLTSKFVQKNGKLLEGAYAPDLLHLTTRGYETLGREIAPVIMEMTK